VPQKGEVFKYADTSLYFSPSEMSVNLTFIDFNDINFKESEPARHFQKILPSTYTKLKDSKYLCKSDPFVLRNT